MGPTFAKMGPHRPCPKQKTILFAEIIKPDHKLSKTFFIKISCFGWDMIVFLFFLYDAFFAEKYHTFSEFCFQRQTLLKGYLCYKTILCHKVALDVQLLNFFIWRKTNVSFLRYQDFCVFNEISTFQICDVIISIAG